MLAFEKKEDLETKRTARPGKDPAARIRPMTGLDLERIAELRSVVRWSADPRAFELLRGIKDARWAVAGTPDGSLVGMVGAVPLGEIGVLCHLAVHHEHRSRGLGAGLASWAVAYLRSRGARTVRLDSTRRAEKLYRALGFRATTPRTIYRKEEDAPGSPYRTPRILPQRRVPSTGRRKGIPIFGSGRRTSQAPTGSRR